MALTIFANYKNKNEFVTFSKKKTRREKPKAFAIMASNELVHLFFFFCAILRNRVNGGRVAFAFLCMRERETGIDFHGAEDVHQELLGASVLFAPMTELLSTCSQCARFVIVGPPTSRPGYWSLASQIKRHAVRRLTTPLLPPDHIKPTFSSFTPTIILCKI